MEICTSGELHPALGSLVGTHEISVPRQPHHTHQAALDTEPLVHHLVHSSAFIEGEIVPGAHRTLCPRTANECAQKEGQAWQVKSSRRQLAS